MRLLSDLGNTEPTNWYQSKFMPYILLYDKQLDGCSTYEKHYHNVQSTVVGTVQMELVTML